MPIPKPTAVPSQMWRVVFVPVSTHRIKSADKGPWHTDKSNALRWARWFHLLGYVVHIEDTRGRIELASFREPTGFLD